MITPVAYALEGFLRGYSTLIARSGMSNVKNYDPHQGQKIIISSENDGNESLTNNIIKDTRDVLSRKGVFL